jgi:hypothetical protein
MIYDRFPSTAIRHYTVIVSERYSLEIVTTTCHIVETEAESLDSKIETKTTDPTRLTVHWCNVQLGAQIDVQATKTRKLHCRS